MINRLKLVALLGLAAAASAHATEFFVRPTVAYIKSSNKDYDDRVSPSIAAGVYLGHRSQHEFAVNLTYTEWEFDDTENGVRYQTSEKFLPVILDYKFHADGWDELRNVSFYIGPSAGATKTKLWLNASTRTQVINDDSSDWVFTYGGTVGFVVKLARHIDLDIGYRYLELNRSKYQVFGSSLYSPTSHVNVFTAGVGYRF